MRVTKKRDWIISPLYEGVKSHIASLLQASLNYRFLKKEIMLTCKHLWCFNYSMWRT